MRCPRCGNENPATNRFCGTCGASLVSEATPATTARADNTTQTAGVRNASASTSETHRTAAPRSSEGPSITGPSFLGLNAPTAPRSGSGQNLQRDINYGPPSRNLDYLLDDEDEPKGVAGKVFLILLALALALGFGYLRWRHEGLSSLWSDLRKPSAAQPVDAPNPSTVEPANRPDSSPSGAGGSSPGQPAPTGPQSPAAPTNSSSSSTGSSTTGSSTGAPAPSPASPDTAAPSAPTDQPTNATSSPATANTPPADKPATDDSNAAAASSSPSEESSEPAPAPKPAAKARRAPKPTAAQPFDQVSEAEKYIYGRGGVRQDCDRGLRMLRPPAEQSNPKAMISLGALYSTGVCAPRDLPTAYRWFALALRKQPDNQPLQENLQRLWAQMTQPERQLAVKLSQ